MTLLRPGALVDGRYQILHAIARGGMGAVFEAEDTLLSRRVALKALLPDLVADAKTMERFRREARAVAAVQHEGLVAIYDVALDASPPYLVMELVEGPSLRDVLAAEGALPVGQALALVADVLDALGALHAAGIVHRDVKPANVLLAETRGGQRARLIDLGVAWMETDAAQEQLTATDAAVGTPAFMAPEQLAGQRVGPAADMWAAGVLLYSLLTGVRPFGAATLAELVGARAAEALRPLHETLADVPPGLDPLVATLLHPDPRERPTDAASVAQQLRAMAAALPARAARPTPVARSAEPARAATAPAGATPRAAPPTPTSATTRAEPPAREGRTGATRGAWTRGRVAFAVAGFLLLNVLALAGALTVLRALDDTPESRAEAAPPAAPSSTFTYAPPEFRLVVQYGSPDEERAVATRLNEPVLRCFPRGAAGRMGWVTGYTVWFDRDGQVSELRNEATADNPASHTETEDGCIRSLLRATTWPTENLQPFMGRWRVTVSVAALPP
ncbi:MAG: serine/threonine protein kinase [Myxococcales bacterium]|nr:serine/threonine protein kinase [Myxococcales bacterium]MCB9629822.1 serine/threonine protein kinase [Sandaracinaceae bacterium]